MITRGTPISGNLHMRQYKSTVIPNELEQKYNHHWTSRDLLFHLFGDNYGYHHHYMGISINGGTPESSILVGFSLINHHKPSIWGYPHLWKPPYSDGDSLIFCSSRFEAQQPAVTWHTRNSDASESHVSTYQ